MKSRLLYLIFGLSVIALISAMGSFLTLQIVKHNSTCPVENYHGWIHKKLRMTPEQERRSLISERRYEETKRHLDEVMRLANLELAQNIRRDQSFSPTVEKSVADIHQAMGKLQKATLEHIFELKDVLDPNQYSQLIELTAQGLSENTHNN
jgi:hypothetical protein